MTVNTIKQYLYNNDNDNDYNNYIEHVNKNVKNMSRTLKNHFLNTWDQKWVARPNRPQPQEPPAPFLMTKSVQKMFF